MSQVFAAATAEAQAAIAALFANAPPVLVEVRFPAMGTSPDWYLIEEEEQFEQVLDRLGPGVELRLSSVWDLKNVKGDVRLSK
jgi:hypothetical protein